MRYPTAQSIHSGSSAHDEHSIVTTHVLVVDDDPQVLSTIARILKRSGFEPIVANSGKEAVRLLESYSFCSHTFRYQYAHDERDGFFKKSS